MARKSLTQRIRDHFQADVGQRPSQDVDALCGHLLGHKTWLKQYVARRFSEAQLRFLLVHLDGVKNQMRSDLRSALVHYAGPQPYAYLKSVRNKHVTRYLQKFHADVLPRKPPFRE